MQNKEISIIIPGWIDKEVTQELYETIRGLCHLLADNDIHVSLLTEPQASELPSDAEETEIKNKVREHQDFLREEVMFKYKLFDLNKKVSEKENEL